jgi:hypothetical protein
LLGSVALELWKDNRWGRSACDRIHPKQSRYTPFSLLIAAADRDRLCCLLPLRWTLVFERERTGRGILCCLRWREYALPRVVGIRKVAERSGERGGKKRRDFDVLRVIEDGYASTVSSHNECRSKTKRERKREKRKRERKRVVREESAVKAECL